MYQMPNPFDSGSSIPDPVPAPHVGTATFEGSVAQPEAVISVAASFLDDPERVWGLIRRLDDLGPEHHRFVLDEEAFLNAIDPLPIFLLEAS